SAQCLITGPSSMCSGAVQLCGDSGPYNWEWTGPNGFTATTQCIFAVEPGTYSLRVYDVNNDLWFGPCTQTITQDTGPSATISGPTSGCAGATVDLCGPAGGYMYTWSGPNGFSAYTQCVSVSQSGTYQLVLRDASSGCIGAPATQTVTFAQAPTSSVSGPAPGCDGTPLPLCGPVGNLLYLWLRPSGSPAS